jgi:hypothetical protein
MVTLSLPVSSPESRYPEGTAIASPENRILNPNIELAGFFSIAHI